MIEWEKRLIKGQHCHNNTGRPRGLPTPSSHIITPIYYATYLKSITTLNQHLSTEIENVNDGNIRSIEVEKCSVYDDKIVL